MADRSLQEFVDEVGGGSHLRVEHDFGEGFVRLRTSEAERRQAAQDIQCSENIVLELLRNSRDAHARHVFMALSKEGGKRSIVVIDDGDGIPASMHEHVFEPRVTSKLDTSHRDAWGLHGRGMALYSISVNATRAFVADSGVERGCSIVVETDTGLLPEKADQSSFPRFEMVEDGSVNVRGPRNILRTSCEFAIESRDSCSVHVGSPAEVAAALYSYGCATLSAIDKAFCSNEDELPLVKRLATASDPADFARIAERMGLNVSERTARRVMDGQIEEAEALLDQVRIERGRQAGSRDRKAASASSSRIKVQRKDAQELAAAVQESFRPIAERYYLEENVDPQVRVSRDSITVKIPLVEREDDGGT